MKFDARNVWIAYHPATQLSEVFTSKEEAFAYRDHFIERWKVSCIVGKVYWFTGRYYLVKRIVNNAQGIRGRDSV